MNIHVLIREKTHTCRPDFKHVVPASSCQEGRIFINIDAFNGTFMATSNMNAFNRARIKIHFPQHDRLIVRDTVKHKNKKEAKKGELQIMKSTLVE